MTSILKPLDTKTALERQHPNFSQEEAPHKHIMSTRAGIIFCCLLAVASAGENIVRVPGVKCGFFDVINHMTLMGFNAKTLDGLTSFDCIEACALEKTFYCRFQPYHTIYSYMYSYIISDYNSDRSDSECRQLEHLDRVITYNSDQRRAV